LVGRRLLIRLWALQSGQEGVIALRVVAMQRFIINYAMLIIINFR